MIISKLTKTFNCNSKKVWNVITNNNDYTWRSDLSRIEIIDENNFIEYNKEFPTYFNITSKVENKEYKFDLKNKNMNGHWTGNFTIIDENTTKVEFIEEIEVKNPIMKLLAKNYLKHMQQTYVEDLIKVLEK